MKRVLSLAACLGLLAVGVALALSPASTVEAAPPADGGVTPAGGDAGSIYLTKAGTGSILPPSVDDAEAFCALVLACRDVPMFPPANDFAGCVHALMEQLSLPNAINASLAIRECGLSATSCKTLRACALKGADPKICDGVAMESSQPIGKCDLDARAITCWRGKVLGVRNCGLADELCVAKEGKAECALAGPCPAGAKSDWTCAGSRMVKCQDGKYLSIDCKVLNLSCTTATDAAGKTTVGCAPPTNTPCKSDKITCSGTTAVGCTFGKEVKIACAEAGMTCADPSKPPTERTVGACEMPTAAKPCDPKTFTAKCTGAAIEYCSHGAIRSYPCKSIGATKCVTDKGTGPRCGA